MENKQFATINFRIHDRLPELVKAREKVEANTEALNAILATLKDITNRLHHLQDTLGWDAFWGNETVKGLLGRGRALMLDGKRVANKNEELINKMVADGFLTAGGGPQMRTEMPLRGGSSEEG
ncbi:MAG: hypothetical protein MMC23_008585 [Stictis urceolatum]|nr:hypothetical protein [Stictis urceolata]